ncbi:sulfurtransferase [Priestia flexa]|uniref:sulfurtransferase n=1 Tax=Priestia flexa TaxID=86664 RepID=UPI0009549FD9|nr:sulfurtransferase [Priestia flexa]MBY6087282.1 sulfurtransferase [Priestia flexa]SIR25367.1 hypothetical protein SAMN05880580_11565 [Priestia flexa]
MSYLTIGMLLVVLAIGYRRYYPVKGVRCVHNHENKRSELLILDIRHYNERREEKSGDELNIPYAYLKRFYNEIPNQTIHIIAEDQLELRLGVRFLRKKGYTIDSYQLTTCCCKQELVGCGA